MLNLVSLSIGPRLAVPSAMKGQWFAAFAASGLLLLTSCSGKSTPTDSTDGGSESGGSGSAQAGKGTSGGSSSENGGGNSGGQSPGGTSNHDQPDCAADFGALDRTCESPSDCSLVQHQTEFCGTILVMGLASQAKPAFVALEQYCAAQFPQCGCAAQGMLLEDGSMIDFGSTAAVAECVEGRCQSRNSEVTSSCGNQACTETQYCEQFVGGPAGSEPSYTCRPLGDCEDCACLNVVGCQCDESPSGIKVSCAAP